MYILWYPLRVWPFPTNDALLEYVEGHIELQKYNNKWNPNYLFNQHGYFEHEENLNELYHT